MLEFFIVDSGFLLDGFPVAICGFVEGDDEVEDVFGFGGDLTEGNSGSGEGGSGVLLLPVHILKTFGMFTC